MQIKKADGEEVFPTAINLGYTTREKKIAIQEAWKRLNRAVKAKSRELLGHTLNNPAIMLAVLREALKNPARFIGERR